MKSSKYILLIICLFSFLNIKALTANYDERVELLSVICNLADYEEYNMGMASEYGEAVARYFEPFKNHVAVNMFKRLEGTKGIGFNAPIDFALNMKKENNEFRLDSHNIGDGRWENLDLDAVCDTISMFYKDAEFEKFFKSQVSFYKETCNQFTDKVLSLINEKWYPEFYGNEPSENFNVVIGFLTGGCNYGPAIEHPDQPRDVYAILGYVVLPEKGIMYNFKPEYYRDVLVHEFNHSFVNPYISSEGQFKKIMEPAGEKLLSQCSTVMEMQAYPEWEIVINESIVRAAVVCYLLDNGSKEEVENSIKEEMKVGFWWMPQLVNKMNYYRRTRDKYPTFASYYPELISFFEDITNATDNEIQNLFEN